jgi:putative Mg2+ transporter-C (MgtC) family protein
MNEIYSSIHDFFNDDFDFLLKLSLAALAGILIGFEREIKKKPVGIKTLLVISVGSALLTMVSIESVLKYSNSAENITMDPMRLAAQIVTGVGFLGAGVIMKRSNDVVSGLTTAAMVWGVSGVGIAIGAGFYKEALLSVVMFIVGIDLVPFVIEKTTRFELNQKVILINLTLDRNQEMKNILKEVKANRINIRNVRVKDDKDKKKILEIRGYMSKDKNATDVYESLRLNHDIQNIEIYE